MIPVNITRRERIYINPYNGKQIPRLTKGLTDDTEDTSDLGDGGETQETGVGEVESIKNEVQ